MSLYLSWKSISRSFGVISRRWLYFQSTYRYLDKRFSRFILTHREINTSTSMQQQQLNLIAAACENMGIGINGTLPWRLKGEMAYFTRMTSNTKDANKKNVVLMGRRTWECIPKKYRPLQGRINMVLTSKSLDLGNEAIICKSISQALEMISTSPLKEEVERIWVIGGHSVYKASMESPNFHRLYLTKIKKDFECDTFFPPIPNDFTVVHDPDVPDGVQTEGDIEYEYLVYEKK